MHCPEWSARILLFIISLINSIELALIICLGGPTLVKVNRAFGIRESIARESVESDGK